MYTTEELKQIATNVRRGILEQVYTAKSGALTAVGTSACNVERADDVEHLLLKLVCGSFVFKGRIGIVKYTLLTGTSGTYVATSVAADTA